MQDIRYTLSLLFENQRPGEELQTKSQRVVINSAAWWDGESLREALHTGLDVALDYLLFGDEHEEVQ